MKNKKKSIFKRILVSIVILSSLFVYLRFFKLKIYNDKRLLYKPLIVKNFDENLQIVGFGTTGSIKQKWGEEKDFFLFYYQESKYIDSMFFVLQKQFKPISKDTTFNIEKVLIYSDEELFSLGNDYSREFYNSWYLEDKDDNIKGLPDKTLLSGYKLIRNGYKLLEVNTHDEDIGCYWIDLKFDKILYSNKLKVEIIYTINNSARKSIFYTLKNYDRNYIFSNSFLDYWNAAMSQ